MFGPYPIYISQIAGLVWHFFPWCPDQEFENVIWEYYPDLLRKARPSRYRRSHPNLVSSNRPGAGLIFIVRRSTADTLHPFSSVLRGEFFSAPPLFSHARKES